MRSPQSLKLRIFVCVKELLAFPSFPESFLKYVGNVPNAHIIPIPPAIEYFKNTFHPRFLSLITLVSISPTIGQAKIIKKKCVYNPPKVAIHNNTNLFTVIFSSL